MMGRNQSGSKTNCAVHSVCVGPYEAIGLGGCDWESTDE